MPTREQVRELLGNGTDYEAAGRKLGIPAGQAYLIATGMPADGSSQRLTSPPRHNPVSKDSVRRWMTARAAADGQMQAAKRRRTAEREGKPG